MNRYKTAKTLTTSSSRQLFSSSLTRSFSTSTPSSTSALLSSSVTSNASSLLSRYSKHIITGLVAGTIAGAIVYSQSDIFHASDKLEPPSYPWSHRLPWQAFDHASIRRGHKVFSTVCSTCHSLNLIHFRNLVDVCYTEEEVKEIAADIEYVDGPDEEGNMFTRPGKLTDAFPKPYENDKQARAANGGAKPPDLSLITKARPDGTNYLFSLLTGYKDPPAGLALRSGLSYNPYFPGAAIAMPQPLTDGQVEFEDGTESSISQMAKDVTTFLAWASEPELETRKLWMWKGLFVLTTIFIPLNYYKRHVWALIKTQLVRFPGKFHPPPPKKGLNWRPEGGNPTSGAQRPASQQQQAGGNDHH